MFDLSPIKILIIVVVILVVLGPDKLPEVARQAGQAWHSLKNLQSKIESEVRDAVPDLPSTSDIARRARNPVGLLNSLADRATAADEEATNAAAAAAHEAPVGAGSPEGESEPQPEILVEPDSIVDLPPRASQVIPPRRATTDVATAPPDASLN